jgi:hypothetical protein
MYGKIFDTIYDGTLAEDWRALITFQQMIVMCDADGVIDMTPQSISRRTGIPLEFIEAGIEILEKIDERSRTPDQEGRRIVRLDEHRPWGWYLVNHEKYKNLQDSDKVREQNRERKRRQREREQSGHVPSRDVTQSHASSRHTDTDTNTELDLDHSISPPCTPPTFDWFWKKYPRKVAKAAAEKAWNKLKVTNELETVILQALEKQKLQPKWQEAGGEFIPHAATWLNQRRWEDEIAPPPIPPAATRAADERVWRDVN